MRAAGIGSTAVGDRMVQDKELHIRQVRTTVEFSPHLKAWTIQVAKPGACRGKKEHLCQLVVWECFFWPCCSFC